MIRAMRSIGIDMAHRVTNHASKCKNVHGHRYQIELTIDGELVKAGSEEGMVADFGFVKDVLMKHIDAPCDHGMTLWVLDPLLLEMGLSELDLETASGKIQRDGYCETSWVGGKLYLIPEVPTAENLAKHWFWRLQGDVSTHSHGQARVVKVRVWETPNCYAEYERF